MKKGQAWVDVRKWYNRSWKNRAALYAARTNRANAPPQQHHFAQGIAVSN
jgi:hypothetical protein